MVVVAGTVVVELLVVDELVDVDSTGAVGRDDRRERREWRVGRQPSSRMNRRPAETAITPASTAIRTAMAAATSERRSRQSSEDGLRTFGLLVLAGAPIGGTRA